MAPADVLPADSLPLVLFHKGGGGHDEAGRAEAALDGTGVHIGLLDAGASGFALGGADGLALGPDREEDTGIHGCVVDKHGARAAFAHAAALLGAGEPGGAQDFKERGADIHGKLFGLAVDGTADGFQHDPS